MNLPGAYSLLNANFPLSNRLEAPQNDVGSVCTCIQVRCVYKPDEILIVLWAKWVRSADIYQAPISFTPGAVRNSGETVEGAPRHQENPFSR